jgi:hypothetical protein
MSLNLPTPNNLNLVRFGPIAVDFTKAGNTTIGDLVYDENIFIPAIASVALTNAAGTFGTQAVVNVNVINSNTNATIGTIGSVTLPATPQIVLNFSTYTFPNGNGFSTQYPISINTGSPVFGLPPVGNLNPSWGTGAIGFNTTTGAFPVANASAGGASSFQILNLNVGTAAVPSLASSSRYTVANISTINLATTIPSWLVAGVTLNVLLSGNAAYNGTVQVLSTSGNSFSYYNPSVATEGSATSPVTDTTARIGTLVGNVYVTGYLF